VTYCGAKPVLADVDPSTWVLDPQDVARKISPSTKAIMPVHIYGHPADMAPLVELAKAHGLLIIEDAAEAHGAEYRAQRVGGLGDIATFSFYGNKIITTGEGGMVTTNDAELARKMRLLKGQGMDPQRRYWFPVVGYNYRLTNLQAAIGLAQLERIEWFIQRRREVAEWYREALDGLPLTNPPQAEWARNVYWLYSVCLPEEIDREVLMKHLMEKNIETRPFFYPIHQLPPYVDCGTDAAFPVSTRLGARGINLPSSATLSQDDVNYIADTLREGLETGMRR
jgi:perosamine synthetase